MAKEISINEISEKRLDKSVRNALQFIPPSRQNKLFIWSFCCCFSVTGLFGHHFLINNSLQAHCLFLSRSLGLSSGPFPSQANQVWITEWLELQGTSKIIYFQAPCHGQGCHWLDQVDFLHSIHVPYCVRCGRREKQSCLLVHIGKKAEKVEQRSLSSLNHKGQMDLLLKYHDMRELYSFLSCALNSLRDSGPL